MDSKKDNFKISAGNIMVLQTIPRMMQTKRYRTELRRLCLDFLVDKENKIGNGKQ
jgi:hypothetical protein